MAKKEPEPIHVTSRDSRYPSRLAAIADPPRGLYILGDMSLLARHKIIAVVGTRRPSVYGIEATRHIVKELAGRGWIIASGLAQGIDGEAHKAALGAGGRTIAVVGSGPDVVYPVTHRDLWKRIAERDCLVSEYPPGERPDKGHFPRRNRIISGLALGVIVVEAGAKSGALITAGLALDQGREVFAVPGPIFSPLSVGTLGLIAQGAKLVRHADDVESEFLWEPLRATSDPSEGIQEGDLSPEKKLLYSILEGLDLSLDEIVERTELPASEVSVLLTEMELAGVVSRDSGHTYHLKRTAYG